MIKLKSLIKEGRRVSFNGTITNQLYSIVKNDGDALIFANGQHYSIDVEGMRNDLQNPTIIAMDDDGGEHDINVSDIEFIEL
jgi:hypothetical protein